MLYVEGCVHVLSCSVVSDSLQPHDPLSMEFSRQEYKNGLSFPTPGDLPDPGIKATSPASTALAGPFFTTEPPGKPKESSTVTKFLFAWHVSFADSNYTNLRNTQKLSHNFICDLS